MTLIYLLAMTVNYLLAMTVNYLLAMMVNYLLVMTENATLFPSISTLLLTCVYIFYTRQMCINDQSKLLVSLLSLTLVLSGCAAVNTEEPLVVMEEVVEEIVEEIVEEAPEETIELVVEEVPPPEEEIEYGHFSEEILSRVILAEMAGQRGFNRDAIEAYLSLARDTKDLGIIKRTSRIAAFSRNTDIAIEMGNMWLVQEPNSLEALQSLAAQMITLSRYGTALEYYSQMLELGADIDFRLITSRTANDPSAEYILDTLIEDMRLLFANYSYNNSILLALATLYEQNDQLQESYEQMNLLAQRMNDAPEIIILEIELLERLGEIEQAQARLEQSLETNPDHKQLRFLYGRKLIDEQRYNDAKDQFAIIVEQDPDDYEMLYSLALISMEVNRLSDAREYFQRLIQNSQRLDDSHYYLAYISTQENDNDQAIEHYLQVQAGSNFLPAQRYVTELMVQQGHYPEASSRLQNIRFRNPDYNIELLSMEANILLASDLKEEASALLNSAVGAFPNNSQLLFLRSVLSAELNDLALMEEDLRKVIRLNPNNPSAYNSLGYTLADRTDRIEEAYTLIKQAVALAPNDPAIMDSLGWVQYRLGLHEDARESLDKAFELFPDHEVAAHLGEVLWVLGNKREANRVWKDALEIQPDSEFILEAMERLTSDSSL